MVKREAETESLHLAPIHLLSSSISLPVRSVSELSSPAGRARRGRHSASALHLARAYGGSYKL